MKIMYNCLQMYSSTIFRHAKTKITGLHVLYMLPVIIRALMNKIITKIERLELVLDSHNYWGKNLGDLHSITCICECNRETKIRMVDFFNPLKSFISLLQLEPAYEDQLKQLEKKFVIITILFQKYEKVFGELLKLPSANERVASLRHSLTYYIYNDTISKKVE
jgi:hypothetical protein